MHEFITAFVAFVTFHSIPAIPAIRGSIVQQIGRLAYLLVYSAASIAALIWVFRAALALDYIPLWDFQPWHAGVTFVLAPVGLFLVLGGLLSRNPLSVSMRTAGQPGAIVRITRHPVLWGFALWAVGHLAANGDLRSLLLFGGFAFFSLGSIPMAEMRARRRLGTTWNNFAAQTSIVPFGGLARGNRLGVDAPMLIGAIAAAALTIWLLLWGHRFLFGADPLSIFM
ncbi:NnrU family protein [Rhizobium sp. CNPSo 3464]|uniref:NnrU family protein n=1 Tax=Rhizobium sp. CNPSo 3464 TaxID=3021406 RepID=UPI00254CEB47|nr:NnrU family protein [Rhizobium sp. CNPSo 3464]MDK4741557.1 NnrU family protein [Rhizobium sp. CNPSo 3464]